MTDSSGFVKKSFAVIFPGQGSQFVGMANDLLENSKVAQDLMAQADSILGYPLSEIMAGKFGDELNRTIYTQPAVFVHSMMLWNILDCSTSVIPRIGAGHSLGEYSALCAAGCLTFEQALRCISVRATEMDNAQPAGTCGMAAVIGLPGERVLDILDSLSGADSIRIANFNSPDQTVVSGTLSDIKMAIEALSREKRCRCVMLPVSSAFHTDLMASAKDRLLGFLTDVDIQPMNFPVIANVTASQFPPDSEEIKKFLAEQVTHPVLWHDSVREMLNEKPDFFVEVGPGKVLAGLMRRIDRNVTCFNMSSLADIELFLGAN